MKARMLLRLVLGILFQPVWCLAEEPPVTPATEVEAANDPGLLSNIRQLTFAGRRSGEGYFNALGNKLIFQSEREPGNPFFQIYLLDLESGDDRRISPGLGKTTCAWLHPDGKRALFASTQLDPQVKAKQDRELADRESGQEKRYAWDYDPHFDLFEQDLESGTYRQLTTETGYDAEGSYSPDGSLIAFASNRSVYQRELTEAEQALLERDPSVFMEIYLMNSDGTNVRRLTEHPGYDGGPFFSPDGQRICWRRFSENGAVAEIMTMNLEGSDIRQLTNWQVMSWAPFYHPSGKYLIFTTNRHGFANFELYVVDALGQKAPVRVTHADGFDGLPAFSPDGKTLVWTCNRTNNKQSQLFRADWNHQLALELLELGDLTTEQAADTARDAARRSKGDFQAADIARHVAFLCREELEGRLTGTEGERLATAYVAAYFEELGLKPGGDNDTYFQEFEFTAGIALGEQNQLQSGTQSLELNAAWRPVSFSQSGKFTSRDLAFAGYGLVAPPAKDREEYDSYVHLDVREKWVVVFRYLPEGISPEQRQEWARFSSLRYKAMMARDRGAAGLIVVSGPNSQVKEQLLPLRFDGSLAGSSIPVISVTDDVVAEWLKPTGKSLKEYQTQLDKGEPQLGFVVENVGLRAEIDIQQVKRTGRNVLGILPAERSGFAPAILVGAHVDHLGRGGTSSSLARDGQQDLIHYGADDNASGTAAMLEIAEYLSTQRANGGLKPRRDIIFAAWSGEELGLYGSNHYVKELQRALEEFARAHMQAVGQAAPETGKKQPAEQKEEKQTAPPAQAPAKEKPEEQAGEEKPEATEDADIPLSCALAACLNMDMVGRFTESLVLQGVGSSSIWKGEIEKRNIVVGLPITLQDDSYIPTDASVFFMNGVPILSAFTGTHPDYHTPQDTPEKLNYEAAARIAKLMGLIARVLVTESGTPDYVAQDRPEEQRRANLRAYLGTIPDYAASDVKGVQISGVGKGAPADQAGLRKADVIIELAGKKIENIYDYTYAIEALKIGEEVTLKVKRGEQTLEMKITPGSRE
ncbi:MAG: M28 family peptidase [Planctomycetaceae bacterium]